MRSAGVVLSLAVVAVAGVSGCAADDEDGTGFLTITDLAAPPQPGHFTAEPAPVRAELRATATGCVTVTVEGVTRMPLWPPNTRVEDERGTYTVRIPDGPSLTATGTGGSSFDAIGVVDVENRPFEADSKIRSHLDFCAIPAAPIAFRDGSGIRSRP